MSIKYQHNNQHQTIPNNNYRLVQIQVDHHQHVPLKNDSVLIYSFFSVFFLLLQCTAPVLSYLFPCFFCLIYLKFLFYKNETKKKPKLLLSSFDKIVCFYMKSSEFSCARRPVNSVCVVDRIFSSLFGSLDCCDNQHQFLPSIIFLCGHTHIFSYVFLVFV
jgi:hypothetical protein